MSFYGLFDIISHKKKEETTKRNLIISLFIIIGTLITFILLCLHSSSLVSEFLSDTKQDGCESGFIERTITYSLADYYTIHLSAFLQVEGKDFNTFDYLKCINTLPNVVNQKCYFSIKSSDFFDRFSGEAFVDFEMFFELIGKNNQIKGFFRYIGKGENQTYIHADPAYGNGMNCNDSNLGFVFNATCRVITDETKIAVFVFVEIFSLFFIFIQLILLFWFCLFLLHKQHLICHQRF